MKLKFESQLHVQRLTLGMLCGLLPICCLLFGLFGIATNLPEWYCSISATFYANSNIWMIGMLILCSFFFATYKGYDIGDKICTTISAITALGVVVFPCDTEACPARVGLFQLPVAISNIIHCIMASLLFASFAMMILTQFTKGNDKKRNICYYICGGIIVAFMLNQVVAINLNYPSYWTMINEFAMLEAFAVAWIVKSKVSIINIKKEIDK